MTRRFLIFLGGFFLLVVGIVEAGPNPIRIPFPGGTPIVRRPVIRPVSDIYIRGLKYQDHSVNTVMGPKTVAPGGMFEITTHSFMYENAYWAGRPIKVVIQDVNTPGAIGGGVTVFELRSFFTKGNTIEVQAPIQALFQNRTYYVTVFVYGAQPWVYASAGTLTIRP